jgi:hypothetical protein
VKHTIVALLFLMALPAFAQVQGPTLEKAATIAYLNPVQPQAWFLPPSPTPAVDILLEPQVAVPVSNAGFQEFVVLPIEIEADER